MIDVERGALQALDCTGVVIAHLPARRLADLSRLRGGGGWPPALCRGLGSSVGGAGAGGILQEPSVRTGLSRSQASHH